MHVPKPRHFTERFLTYDFETQTELDLFVQQKLMAVLDETNLMCANVELRLPSKYHVRAVETSMEIASCILYTTFAFSNTENAKGFSFGIQRQRLRVVYS
jgi:hypothetical protein